MRMTFILLLLALRHTFLGSEQVFALRAIDANTVALRYESLFALKQLQVNCLSFGFESKVSFRYDLLKL